MSTEGEIIRLIEKMARAMALSDGFISWVSLNDETQNRYRRLATAAAQAAWPEKTP